MLILGLFPSVHQFGQKLISLIQQQSQGHILYLLLFGYFSVVFCFERRKPEPRPDVALNDACEPHALPFENRKLFPQLVPQRVSSCSSTFLSIFPPFFSSISLLLLLTSPLFVLLTPHLLLLLIPACLFAPCPVLVRPSNHCFNHPCVSLLQDGSCNGLQHYAALGRDVIGATSVNLMPCEVPQDVYSGVAQQVSVVSLLWC